MTTTDNTLDLETLAVADVAKLLGVRPEAVRVFVREGRLEAMRWGRRLHFRPDAVRRFQEAARVDVADPAAAARAARPRSRREPA